MSRLVACILAALVAALPTAGSDPINEYPWLHLGSADDVPEIPDAWLRLDEERQRELKAAGWGVVELLWRFDLSVDGDGSLRNRLVMARQFLTSEGIQQSGTMSVRARAGIERSYLERAFVRLPDGRTRDFDMRRVQVLPDQEINVFSDQYRIVFPFEGLVPGATAVVVTSRRRPAQAWPLPWSSVFYTRWFLPVERVLFTASSDTAAAQLVWRTNDDGLQCEEQEGRLRCEAQRRKPLRIDEQVPSMYDLVPHVVVSEPHGWSDIAQAVGTLVDDRSRSTGDLVATARRLVEGSETDREKLERIHRFVADEIRYVGLEHGRNAVVPAAASRTLDRRYGDCKDKTTLFLALAREARLSAWPVLVGSDHHALDKLLAPSWRYFDHMIACVKVGDGPETICADLTDPHSATGSLPLHLYGKIALDVRPGASEPRKLETPIVVHDVLVEVENDFDCEAGGLIERVERTYTGPTASFYRANLRPLTVEAREEWAVNGYRAVMGNNEKPTIEFEGVDDSASDLVIRSEVRYEQFDLSAVTEYTEPDLWLAHFAEWFTTANETLAYVLRGGQIRTVNSYHVCGARPVRFLGAELKLDSEFGSLRRHYDKKRGGTVIVNTRLLLPTREVEPDRLEAYRRFLANSLAQTTIWFDFADSAAGVAR